MGAREFSRIMNGKQKFVIGKRFGYVIKRPVFHHFNSTFNGAERGHDQYGNVWPAFLDPLQHFAARDPWHFHVGHHHVHFAFMQKGQRGFRIADGRNRIALVFQKGLQDKKVVFFVVNNQN